jgi:F-type H+-transporting ATPase subunit delta
MIETKVAKRYAKSLIDLSNDKGVLDAVNNDLKLFNLVCEENRELGLMLSNPIIHSDKKLKTLQQIFTGKMNSLTMSFFEIVIRKGREKYLPQIAKDFIEQFKILKRIITAEVISAIGLDDKLRKKIYDLVRTESNSEVELIEKVDNKLIGGFVLRIGDRQYDASVSSEIRKLAQTFASNSYIKRN